MKLYVLTGFLGAGKTSLLKKLLLQESDRKIGVIMNEFGKISIDGELISSNGVNMTQINRGSIFCSCLKLNFVQALAEMLDQDLDLVVVESSGLADPSNIAEILAAVEQIKGKAYDYAGAICVIDAVDFLDQVDELATVYRQTKHCQLAVISKGDLVSQDQIKQVEAKIRSINPDCLITYANFGALELDLLTTDLRRGKELLLEDTTNTEETKPKTISMDIREALSREELLAFLRTVARDTYRIKGPVELTDGPVEVDVVKDRIDLREPTADHPESRLVFISKVGPAIIRSVNDAWKELVGKAMKLKN